MTDSRIEATMSKTAAATRCIICTEPASGNIIKDEHYMLLLDLYWAAIRLDVKPEINRELDVCTDCFGKLNRLLDFNDTLVYNEKGIGQLVREMLTTNVNGIVNLQQNSLPLNWIQSQVIANFTTHVPQEVDPERKKPTRKYHVFDVNNSYKYEKESSGSQNEASKNSPTKRPQQRKQNGKKKLRRGRSHQSDDESDGSNYSDDTVLSPGQQATGSGIEREISSRKSITVSSKANEEETSPAKIVTVTEERKCKICLDKFDSYSTFIKHRRQHRVGENEDKYECRYCLQQFNMQVKLIEHKKNCSDI